MFGPRKNKNARSKNVWAQKKQKRAVEKFFGAQVILAAA